MKCMGEKYMIREITDRDYEELMELYTHLRGLYDIIMNI